MKVVIVGGGFGGVRTALDLAKDSRFQVRLISPRSYFEYHAALYRSATGRSPLEVAIPLRDFFARYHNIEVVQDTVIELNAENKSVRGASGAIYPYDSLVLALGAVTAYYGIEGLEEYSFGVKTIHEALELKRRIHEDLVSGQKPERNYVVIGGGATGVELAGELVSYVRHVRKRHKVAGRFNVDLIEASPHVLPSLPTHFTGRIERRLKKLGVKLYLKTPVKNETIDAIELPGGDIKSHMVVWTAGMTNNPFYAKYPELFELGKGGKVTVNDFLEARPDIYVIGDSASTQYSGMAQTAIHDANFVAGNLKRIASGKLRQPYQPKRPIYAIPAGRNWSAVLWGKVKFYGYPGWTIRRLADLRLYFLFMPIAKALTAWRYGFVDQEACDRCR